VVAGVATRDRPIFDLHRGRPLLTTPQSFDKCFIFSLQFIIQLEGKYYLESTDPRESEIRAPPQPLPYLMPIPPNTLFYNK